ncbi:MAG: DUF4397 domain-containing protein [Cytophagales bacterium]|nr:DUF4397 domain-containing protein [Bernardetiaceae bacterium]MDW8206113.1 DUF4397 domain-containing protein [Cytophagales bacterium]
MRTIYVSILIIVGLALLTACQKEVVGLGEEKDKAKILFVNAAFNASPIPFQARREIAIYPFYNGVQFNNHPIRFPWTNGYKAFEPGTMNMRFDTAQSQANDPPGPAGRILEFSFPTQADKYYTVFAVGTLGLQAHRPESLVIEDDLSLPSPGKAKVRVFNLCPNATALDVVTSTGVTLASNLPFKGRRDFFEIDPGTYTVQVRAPGSTTNLVTRGNIIIDPASCYTIYITGWQPPLPSPGNTFGGYSLGIQYLANRWTNPLK